MFCCFLCNAESTDLYTRLCDVFAALPFPVVLVYWLFTAFEMKWNSQLLQWGQADVKRYFSFRFPNKSKEDYLQFYENIQLAIVFRMQEDKKISIISTKSITVSNWFCIIQMQICVSARQLKYLKWFKLSAVFSILPSIFHSARMRTSFCLCKDEQ